MKTTTKLLFNAMLAILLMVQSLTGHAAQGPQSLTIAYTGPLQGELEPCGCTLETDYGGIRRLATTIDQMRTTQPQIIVLGIGAALGTTQPVHTVTNAFILTGLQQLGYDSIGLHWGDLIYGPDALARSPLPWVATNWSASQAHPSISAKRIIERDDTKVTILHWLDPGSSPHREQPDTQHLVSDNLESLASQIRSARAESALVVLGTDASEQILEQLPIDLIDVLLLASEDEQFAQPHRRGTTLILRAGTRGQRIGTLNLSPDANGSWRIDSHRVIELDDSTPDSARLADWYQQYEAALKEDYEAREKQALEHRGAGEFVGDAICGICHSKEKAQWQQTRHARAYDSLVAVGKQFDANCVGCHVVGFGQPGGFYSTHAKPDLRQVGCEACHGPAKAHQTNGGTKPLVAVTEAVCTTCHNRQHSPQFDLKTYLPQVNHGKK